MATKAQVEKMIEKMECARPAACFRRFNEKWAGIGAVLQLLYGSTDGVTAGQISEVLKVSTARVAALLKKMEEKELITREHGGVDARVVIVRLTEHGTETVREMRANMYRQVELLIDEIGEERLLEFVDIAVEIQSVVAKQKSDFRGNTREM